eukprot:1159917-Pelagomonas_calceolata.AAC.3
MSGVHALWCYKLPCYKLPFAGQHEVPDVLKKELLGVCRVSEESSALCVAFSFLGHVLDEFELLKGKSAHCVLHTSSLVCAFACCVAQQARDEGGVAGRALLGKPKADACRVRSVLIDVICHKHAAGGVHATLPCCLHGMLLLGKLTEGGSRDK